MSQGNQKFRFELNESIYFEKGQEVSEMKGISLDPDITIEPYNDYISIRGVIELQGEYEKKEYEEEDEENVFDLDNFESKHYVERVLDTEDGDATFLHRFPVEISVPTYRITDLNDVTVYIESFDYELPEDNHLKLYSTIEIHGIHETVKERDAEIVEEDTEEETVDFESPEEDSFQFEWKEQAEPSPEQESSHTDHLPVLEERENDRQDDQESVEEPSEKDRWKYKETKTLKEFFAQMPSGESESSSSSSSENSNSTDEWIESYESESSSTSFEISSEDREEPLQEDVNYLSAMFRGKEEEAYAKLRVCIVQDKDTIESIAERYEITALQLIKQNGLDEEFEIRTGQLLYIP